MSMRRLATFLGFLAAAVIALQFAVESDTWWHLAAGRWMVEHGRILQHDPFSQIMQGQTWANPSWLAQLLLYAVHRWAGLPGLNVLTGVLALVGLALLWRLMEGPALLRSFVLVLAASAAAVFWSARPHMFTFLFAAVFIHTLERWRRGEADRLWLLPLLSLLWVNLHGGFAVGPLILAAYVVGTWVQTWVDGLADGPSRAGALAVRAWRRSRGLLLVGGLSIFLFAVNPQGPRLLLYPFDTISIDVLRLYIQEWQSPDFHSRQFLPYTLMLMATMAALALSPKRKSASELLLVFGFTYLSLDAARNVSLFVLAAAPALSRHGHAALAPLLRRLSAGPELPAHIARRLNVVLAALTLLAASLWAAPKLAPVANQQHVNRTMPVAAVDALLREQPAGPIFNTYRWGGFLIWRAHPDYTSFVDGRTDLFGDHVLQEYLTLWSLGEGWRSALERRGFQVALIETGAPIAAGLEQRGWHTLYEDPLALLLTAP